MLLRFRFEVTITRSSMAERREQSACRPSMVLQRAATRSTAPLNHALVSAHTSEQHAGPELNLPRRQAREADPAELRVPERRVRIAEVRTVEEIERLEAELQRARAAETSCA